MLEHKALMPNHSSAVKDNMDKDTIFWCMAH